MSETPSAYDGSLPAAAGGLVADFTTTQPRSAGVAIPKAPSGFAGVQALRAVAAMLVVAMHTDEMWHLRLDPIHAENFWRTGAAGVDIFFVISGFVMMISSHRLVPARAWREFVRRRLVRIVPMYWVATTLKIASVLAVPSLALRTILTPGAVVFSYLFLPWHNAPGDIGPVLPVGWTLNLEMAFYFLFAAAIASGWGILRVVLPLLAVAAAAAALVTPDSPGIALYGDPIVLEFGAGLCLGRMALRGRILPAIPAALALTGGFVLLLWVPPMLPRVLSWGGPATLIVAGAIGCEPAMRRLVPRWLVLLGDASYAIYLTHALVLAAFVAILQHSALPPEASFAMTLVLGCLLSAAVGVLFNRLFEQPVLAACRRFYSATAG